MMSRGWKGGVCEGIGRPLSEDYYSRSLPYHPVFILPTRLVSRFLNIQTPGVNECRAKSRILDIESRIAWYVRDTRSLG